jgi:hypothetical protein
MRWERLGLRAEQFESLSWGAAHPGARLESDDRGEVWKLLQAAVRTKSELKIKYLIAYYEAYYGRCVAKVYQTL